MRDMHRLRAAQRLKDLTSQCRVAVIKIEFDNQLLLLGNMALAFGNVPFRLLEVLQSKGPIDTNHDVSESGMPASSYMEMAEHIRK